MATPKKPHGRPDLPSEAAMRATLVARRGLEEAGSYLRDETSNTRGADFTTDIELVEKVVAQLDEMEAVLTSVRAVDPAPDAFFELMAVVDAEFVRLNTHLELTDSWPPLQGVQGEVRMLVRRAEPPMSRPT